MWNRKIQVEESAPPDVWFQAKRSDRLARKHELDFFLSRLQEKYVYMCINLILSYIHVLYMIAMQYLRAYEMTSYELCTRYSAHISTSQ